MIGSDHLITCAEVTEKSIAVLLPERVLSKYRVCSETNDCDIIAV